jgi:hypothetical protein
VQCVQYVQYVQLVRIWCNATVKKFQITFRECTLKDAE